MTNIKGTLIVISAPSGGGKSTLANELLSRFPGSHRALTATTRPPRSTEIPEQDYHFISENEFDERIKADRFAEWAHVHQHRYGIPREAIESALNTNGLLFLIIDVQGAETIKKQYPSAVTIFVGPPDFDVLEQRLRKRGTEDEADIRKRLENARKEIAQSKKFDFVVLNDRLERAALEIESIIRKQMGK